MAYESCVEVLLDVACHAKRALELRRSGRRRLRRVLLDKLFGQPAFADLAAIGIVRCWTERLTALCPPSNYAGKGLERRVTVRCTGDSDALPGRPTRPVPSNGLPHCARRGDRRENARNPKHFTLRHPSSSLAMAALIAVPSAPLAIEWRLCCRTAVKCHESFQSATARRLKRLRQHFVGDVAADVTSPGLRQGNLGSVLVSSSATLSRHWQT